MATSFLRHPHYTPDTLLDVLIELLNVKADVGLSPWLGILPLASNMIRHRRLVVGAMMLILMRGDSGLAIRELHL